MQSSALKLGTQRELWKTISLALTFESVFKEFEISRGSEEGLYGKSLEKPMCSGEIWVSCVETSFWKVELQVPQATDRNNRAWGDIVQHFQTSKAQQLTAFLGKAWLHFIPCFCWRSSLNVAGVLLVGGSWIAATGTSWSYGELLEWRIIFYALKISFPDGETEAPPACEGKITSHQACSSYRAELLVSAQKVLAALCLGVELSVWYILPGKCCLFKRVSPLFKAWFVVLSVGQIAGTSD